MNTSVKARITWINSNAADARKATASVTIADAFQVHGINIFQGKNGVFLNMPQRRSRTKMAKRNTLILPILSPQRCEKQSAMPYSELTPRKWDWPIRTRLAIRPKKEIFRVLLPRVMLRKLIQCQRKSCLRMKTRICRLSQ